MAQMNPIKELQSRYRARPKARQKETFWQFLRKENPYMFSNHPAAPIFREHVWDIGGFYWCKGFLISLVGILVGLLIYLTTALVDKGWLRYLEDWQVAIVFVAMLLPTVFTSFVKASRPVKLVARFILGMLIGSAIVMLFVANHWASPLIIIATYLGVRIPLSRKRKKADQATFDEYVEKLKKRRKGIPYAGTMSKKMR